MKRRFMLASASMASSMAPAVGGGSWNNVARTVSQVAWIALIASWSAPASNSATTSPGSKFWAPRDLASVSMTSIAQRSASSLPFSGLKPLDIFQ